MKHLETKYNNKPIYLFITIYILLLRWLIKLTIKVANSPIEFKFLILISLIILSSFLTAKIIGSIIGIIKGKLDIKKQNDNIEKSNPYIYYRELPNNYGIGINSLLLDSKIENYKDIIAVILDLCAKKYITLTEQKNKYYVKVLKKDDNNLLKNEKYVLNLIIKKDINNINYDQWYIYCLMDGIDLGLYLYNKNNNKNKDNNNPEKQEKIRKIHIAIVMFLPLLVLLLFSFGNQMFHNPLSLQYFNVIILFLVVVPIVAIFIFMCIKYITKVQKKIEYNIVLDNNLVKTEKGKLELQKLISFKKFLSEFGHFVDKNVNEIVLWDRYLSYAQLFGLSEEIMNTGYTQLINNSSFQIDSINNLNLTNLEL